MSNWRRRVHGSSNQIGRAFKLSRGGYLGLGSELEMLSIPKADVLPVALSPAYAHNWTTKQGLRELIANALDTHTPVNIYKEGDYWIIEDKGKTPIRREHWVMGMSGHREQKDLTTIGQFGEGFKVGSVVLLRSGKEVEFHTAGENFKPKIELDPTFNTEILRVKVEQNQRVRGTKILIKGITDDEINEAKNLFLKFRDDVRILKQDGREFIFTTDKVERHIAIRGLIVKPISSLFSYNIVAKDIQDRDREKITDADIQKNVKPLLGKLSDKESIKRLLSEMLNRNSTALEVQMRFEPKHKKIWREALAELLGTKKVALKGQYENNLEAQFAGYKVVEPNWYGEDVLEHIGIKKADSLSLIAKKKRAGSRRITKKSLEPYQRENFKQAKKLIQKYAKNTGDKELIEVLRKRIKIHNELGVEDGVVTRGRYDGAKDVIRITKEATNSRQRLIGTIMHEYAHRQSSAGDYDRKFHNKLTEFLGLAVDSLHRTRRKRSRIQPAIEPAIVEPTVGV